MCTVRRASGSAGGYHIIVVLESLVTIVANAVCYAMRCWGRLFSGTSRSEHVRITSELRFYVAMQSFATGLVYPSRRRWCARIYLIAFLILLSIGFHVFEVSARAIPPQIQAALARA